jgi:hypothetical protein
MSSNKEESIPAASEPPSTELPSTEPKPSEPEPSKPVESKIAEPVESKQEEPKQEESKQEEPKPEESKPEESKSKPEESKPVEPEPVEPEPEESKTEESKPVEENRTVTNDFENRLADNMVETAATAEPTTEPVAAAEEEERPIVATGEPVAEERPIVPIVATGEPVREEEVLPQQNNNINSAAADLAKEWLLKSLAAMKDSLENDIQNNNTVYPSEDQGKYIEPITTNPNEERVDSGYHPDYRDETPDSGYSANENFIATQGGRRKINHTSKIKYTDKYMKNMKHMKRMSKRRRRNTRSKKYRGGQFGATQWTPALVGNNYNEQLQHVGKNNDFNINPSNSEMYQGGKRRGGSLGSVLAQGAAPAALFAAQYLYGKDKPNVYSRNNKMNKMKRNKSRRYR